MRRAHVQIFGALIATGVCTLSASAQAPNGAAAAQAAAAVPKTVWEVAADGTALNPQSQLQCPATVGEFHRTKLSLYNPFGIDVSCEYQNVRREVVTLYFALRPTDALDQVFDTGKTEMAQRFPTAKQLPETEQKTFASSLDWRYVVFGSSAAQVGVWMTKVSGWLVQFRATYATRSTDQAFAAMASLSATMAKTAGEHIAVCDTLPAVERPGKRITNEKMFPALSVSGTMMAQTIAQDAAKSRNDTAWCLVQPMLIDNSRFLLWRSAAEQNGGAADRITALAENAPVIYLIGDTAWPQVIKDAEKPKQVYDLIVDAEPGTSLVGVFEGRPPVQDLARAAAKNAMGLYSLIDKKAGKTTIYKPPL
jgi:hypothetical protein